MSAVEGATEPTECADPSRGKSSTNPLERKIRCLEKQRKELLEVNRQWDQQFRSMKELYAGKLAELQTKLEATERFLSGLEKGRPASPRASAGPADLAQEQQQREEKEKQSQSEELLALKKENKLLKENNAAMSRRREHYECEIKRLNKALQEALKVECAPLPEDRLGGPEAGCGHEDMRTEMEVLRQQVQIYEEDFRRERSDRERLNQEKEQLQQMNRTSQSQLSQLKSEVKACRLEQERLERQLEQMRIPACRCGLGLHLPDAGAPAGPGAVPDLPRLPPDRQRGAPGRLPPDAQHAAHGFSSEKKDDQ
ncbi:TNFAIP3-interacting protein 3 isoform X2 [Myotis daubentonii]|uniref:TNFAIP3-interacting protein 3 isoform X2 n=1 Tax=Myotis daubentonii TaxID=98922 RepID=UPI0028730D4A|nr:TNFAIP3-interacting protein 3 isoform X2 [Myotis daubentonii]